MKINPFATLLRNLVVVGAIVCVTPATRTMAQPPDPKPFSFLDKMPPLNEEKLSYRRGYVRSFVQGIKKQDEETKKLLTSYVVANSEGAWPLHYLAYQLRVVVNNPEWTDQDVALMLAELRSNLASESERRAGAVKVLQEQPAMQGAKMQRLLLIAGESGDEQAVVYALPKALSRIRLNFQSPADNLAQALTSLGVTDEKTRAAITAYCADYEQGVVPLLYQRDMMEAVSDSPEIFAPRAGVSADDDGLRELMQRYRDSVAKFKAGETEKLRALDEEIGYSKKPRLEAALLLLGLTDTSIRFVDEAELDINYLRYYDPITGVKSARRKSPREEAAEESKVRLEELLSRAEELQKNRPKTTEPAR